MRVKVALSLYEKTSDCVKSLEGKFNSSLLLLVVAIYGNLFMPFRLVLNLFSNAHAKVEDWTWRCVCNELKSKEASSDVVDSKEIKCLFPIANRHNFTNPQRTCFLQCVETQVRKSSTLWAPLLHCVRHPPAFTVYRIGIVDRSVMFKLLIAIITHGALQGQLQLAEENASI
ncbi:hypothetical protein EVAR_31394_1 [Eumeta japonica]|uniref:Uncharacterized protein n=1 Tax=Eumeta variegata TaxID=151549 RepID=A0A4C1UXP7_EUMVA|nr:hypothetical protein EVAR_31394_1 [Eumeta japonica]